MIYLVSFYLNVNLEFVFQQHMREIWISKYVKTVKNMLRCRIENLRSLLMFFLVFFGNVSYGLEVDLFLSFLIWNHPARSQWLESRFWQPTTNKQTNNQQTYKQTNKQTNKQTSWQILFLPSISKNKKDFSFPLDYSYKIKLNNVYFWVHEINKITLF